jgi:hypothetical protein
MNSLNACTAPALCGLVIFYLSIFEGEARHNQSIFANLTVGSLD